MCDRLDILVNSHHTLFKQAEWLGLSGTHPRPAHCVPLVHGIDDTVAALWGVPRSDRSLHTHTHSASDAQTATWRTGWKRCRGIIPVGGWWDHSWHITGTGMHLAVLWEESGGVTHVVIVTQDAGTLAHRLDRSPIPLTEDGALKWIASGDFTDQVSDFSVVQEAFTGNENGTFFGV